MLTGCGCPSTPVVLARSYWSPYAQDASRLGARGVDAAITRFDILRYDRGGASQLAVHIVAGDLHIVCGANAPTICTRKRVVQLLPAALERYTALNRQVPIVRLVVGDNNLSTAEARQAHQRMTEEGPLWEVHPASA